MGLRLDIACGQNRASGFKGIDIAPGSDIVHDLFEFPWPIKSNSVVEVICNHFVEHIPHEHPGWKKDGWWLFFEELHRVMKKDAIATITHPYVMNGRAFWDPTHTRYIHEMTWYYLDLEWRKSQFLDHYDTNVNFQIINIEGMGVPDDAMNRSQEQQMYMRTHYWNVVSDLRVILKKKAS